MKCINTCRLDLGVTLMMFPCTGFGRFLKNFNAYNQAKIQLSYLSKLSFMCFYCKHLNGSIFVLLKLKIIFIINKVSKHLLSTPFSYYWWTHNEELVEKVNNRLFAVPQSLKWCFQMYLFSLIQSPKPKYIQFVIKTDSGNQTIFTMKEMEPENLGMFALKKLNNWNDYLQFVW